MCGLPVGLALEVAEYDWSAVFLWKPAKGGMEYPANVPVHHFLVGIVEASFQRLLVSDSLCREGTRPNAFFSSNAGIVGSGKLTN